MKEILFNEIQGIVTGHAQNIAGGTGCTVLIAKEGACAGVDIRGGGPASRETQLLHPLSAAERIHAVLLSGGSAFGLDAAGGVMRYLEEKEIGFDTGIAKVPLVCQSNIFDLGVGDSSCRPDAQMAYDACVDSKKNHLKEGCVGVGTGATVGKLLGPLYMMKSGLGTYGVSIGELQVGCLVVVNALGDVLHPEKRNVIAGLYDREKKQFLNSKTTLYAGASGTLSTNTTLGVVVTNAKFSKAEMNKIAAMAQNGLARTIAPIHTTFDGDSMYALSVGQVQSDLNLVGTLASDVAAIAVNRAVETACAMYDLPCAREVIR